MTDWGIDRTQNTRRVRQHPVMLVGRHRSGDAAIRGMAEFARASDEFAQPMVIALLPADCGAHAVIIACGQTPDEM